MSRSQQSQGAMGGERPNPAGTYEAQGGDACYWERLSGVSGEFDDLIANDLPNCAIVETRKSDYAFNSSGCGEWTMRG